MNQHTTASTPADRRIRFHLPEWSGALGDLGTDLPLIVGVILASDLNAASVLTVFGMMQIVTALHYRLPMPVQPLKAMAAIVIAQQVPANVLYGGGLAVGICMLVLAGTGLLGWIQRSIPKPVVRGIQLGLGLQLAGIALGRYVPADGASGWWLAGCGFLVALFLMGRRNAPAALVLALFGGVYAMAFKLDAGALAGSVGFHLPEWHQPSLADVWTGFVLLAIPQIPLSIANSVLATHQLVKDLFPHRQVGVRRIGLTYSLMNLVNPFLGGMPTCHGSGGMAGHYAFGGRTGGSVILYGLLFVGLGLFWGPGFESVVQVFPLPMLGVLLLFEAMVLVLLVRDLAGQRTDFFVAVVVGLMASLLPYGYLIGLLAGVLLSHLLKRGWVHLAK
jgi:hypothetical protein